MYEKYFAAHVMYQSGAVIFQIPIEFFNLTYVIQICYLKAISITISIPIKLS